MGLSYSSQFIPGSSIMRPFFVLLLLWYAAIPAAVFAQDGDSQESAQCTFDDGKQMIVRFNSLKVGKNDSPPYGKTWSPGGAAMTLDRKSTRLNSSHMSISYAVFCLKKKKKKKNTKNSHK